MNKSRKIKKSTLTPEVATQAIEVAYQLMLELGLYTLRKHNGFGKKRLKEFKKNFDNTIIGYNNGSIARKDMIKELRDQDMDIF